MDSKEELRILWLYEQIRRNKSYEYLLSDVTLREGFFKEHVEEVNVWNRSKIKEWSKRFKEITGDVWKDRT